MWTSFDEIYVLSYHHYPSLLQVADAVLEEYIFVHLYNNHDKFNLLLLVYFRLTEYFCFPISLCNSHV